MRQFIQNPVFKFMHSYTDTPIDNAWWVEIIPAMPVPASAVEIFSSSGAVLKLSKGAAGNEDQEEFNYYVIPGGSSIFLPLEFPKGVRISAICENGTADSGVLVLNFFG